MFASEFLCVLCGILCALCGLRFSPFQTGCRSQSLKPQSSQREFRKGRKDSAIEDTTKILHIARCAQWPTTSPSRKLQPGL